MMLNGGQAGAGGGRGQGRGQGKGGGRGQNRGKGGKGLGPEGQCICPSCGEVLKHELGVPCNTLKCPKCGHEMTR